VQESSLSRRKVNRHALIVGKEWCLTVLVAAAPQEYVVTERTFVAPAAPVIVMPSPCAANSPRVETQCAA
jgi:hypothetical protein